MLARQARGRSQLPCERADRYGFRRVLRRSPPTVRTRVSTELLDLEQASLEGLPDADVRAALAILGEEAPGDVGRAELLHRLAARRVAERARVVALPLRFTTTGARRGSRRYLTIPVNVGDLGFLDFLLEAGTYGALITPRTRELLGISETDGSAVRALTSSGPTLRQKVALPEMWIGTYKLPPLDAFVSALPVARYKKDVGGLLGVKVLRRLEVDADFGGNRLVLHPAGHAAAGLLDTAGLLPVSCRFTKRGVCAIPVSLNGSPPFLGILDLSAALSILNWEAARLLGMRCEEEEEAAGGGAALPGEEQGEEGDGQAPGAQLAAGAAAGGGAGASAPSAAEGAAAGIGRGYFGSVEFAEPLRRPCSADGGASSSSVSRSSVSSGSSSSGSSSSGSSSSGSSSSGSSSSGDGPAQHPGAAHAGQAPSPSGSSSAGTGRSGSDTSQASAGQSSGGQRGSRRPLPPGLRPPPALPLPPALLGGGSDARLGGAGGGIRLPPYKPASQQPRPPPQRPARGPASSGRGGGTSITRVVLQQHTVDISQVRLVLGDARLGGAARLRPPAKLAVAHLSGLAQLGLGGQPAMVLGGDILGGRPRFVLCLRAGVLHLAPADGDSRVVGSAAGGSKGAAAQ